MEGADVKRAHRELALELTKLTLETRNFGHMEWSDLSGSPEKWKEYVQRLYAECLATVAR